MTRSGRPRRALAILAWMCAVSLGACGGSSSKGPSPAPLAGSYDNSQFHFAIRYPADWTKEENEGGAAVTVLSPARGSADHFRENVNVVAHDLGSRTVSLQEFTDTNVQDLRTSISDIHIDLEGDSTLAGRPAHELTYSGIVEGRSLRFHQVWTVSAANTGFVVTYSGQGADFDFFRPTADRIIASFRLT
jgi:hypothetical protein